MVLSQLFAGLFLVLTLSAMRKAKGKLSGFYHENKLPILVVLGLFLLYKLRGLFSAVGSVGDALGSVVGAATAKIQVNAQSSADKVKLDNAIPASKKPYQFTAADTQRYRTAAQQCASALGTSPGQLSNVLFTDDAALYSAVKPYGRASLGTGGRALVDAKGNVIARPLTGRYDYVIAPFYNELTSRSLQVDLDAAFPISPGIASSADFKARCSFYRKFIRV